MGLYRTGKRAYADLLTFMADPGAKLVTFPAHTQEARQWVFMRIAFVLTVLLHIKKAQVFDAIIPPDIVLMIHQQIIIDIAKMKHPDKPMSIVFFAIQLNAYIALFARIYIAGYLAIFLVNQITFWISKDLFKLINQYMTGKLLHQVDCFGISFHFAHLLIGYSKYF